MMKKLTYVLLTMLILTAVACSKSSDDDSEVSDNCYISAFTLGQIRRQVTTTTSNGVDTTYYLSYSGSAFPMVINQVERTISLSSPLLSDSRFDAVLTTVTFTGALFHAPENDTTTWVAYSSTDSIDFTTPRIYRVISTDGHSYRDYRVWLTKRAAPAEAYTWVRSSEPMPDVQLDAIDLELTDELRDDYQIIAELSYVQRNGNPRQLLACCKNDAEPTEPLTVWSRILLDDEEWMRFDLSEDNPYGLVAPDGVSLVSYDDYLLAFVNGSRDILISHDNGITWKKNTNLTIPSDIPITADDGTPLTMTAVAIDDLVWLAVGDQVWTIRSNSYGEE